MDLNRLSEVENEHRRKEVKIRQKGMQRFGKSCLCESSSQTVISNTQNVKIMKALSKRAKPNQMRILSIVLNVRIWFGSILLAFSLF